MLFVPKRHSDHPSDVLPLEPASSLDLGLVKVERSRLARLIEPGLVELVQVHSPERTETFAVPTPAAALAAMRRAIGQERVEPGIH
jgi:hypothetical protein